MSDVRGQRPDRFQSSIVRGPFASAKTTNYWLLATDI